jgi:hypothetical protein
MYTVYADGKCIYAPNTGRPELTLSTPKITFEKNKAGKFEFTMPKSNVAYNDLKKLMTIITVYDDDTEIWRGRVLNDTANFYNEKKVVCEGELAFLNDGLVMPYDYDNTYTDHTLKEHFDMIVNDGYYNKCSENRKIHSGIIASRTVNDVVVNGDTKVNANTVKTNSALSDNDFVVKSENHQNPLSVLLTMIDKWGGYLKIRSDSTYGRVIDWLADDSSKASQEIIFGKNMLDLSKYINAEDVFTVLYAYGSDTDSYGDHYSLNYNGNVTVNGGKEYIENKKGIDLFGRINKVLYYDGLQEPRDIKEAAVPDLEKSVEAAITITINAADLHLLNPDIKTINLCDWVHVVSEPHGIDENYQCTKITLDMENPTNTKYEIGSDSTSVSSRQNATSSTASSAAATADKAASDVVVLKNDMETLKVGKLDADFAKLTYATITDLTATNEAVENLEAKALTADSAVITSLQTNKANVTDLNATNETVKNLEVNKADITDLNATNETVKNLEAKALTADSAIITSLQTNKADITDLNATNETVKNLEANALTADSALITELQTGKANVVDLNATNETVKNLSANKADITDLNATNEIVEDLKASKADITDLNATNETVKNLEATKADIDDLNAINADIDTLNATTGNIETLLSGQAGVGTLQAIHLSSDNVVIADATITDAMIADLSADKITAGTIYTSIVKIASDQDENMLIDGATIQIRDTNGVLRIQIGKDGDDDYSMYIWGKDGTLLWQPTGITGEGIGNGTIKNVNVANDAAIDGSKLNIRSVASALNDDGSLVVDSANVTVDDKTLSVAYKEVTTSVSNAQAVAEAAQNSVDNIQIGGTNLCKGTSSEWSDWWEPTPNKAYTGTTPYKIALPDATKAGEQYTTSFEVEFSGFAESSSGSSFMCMQGAVDEQYIDGNPFSNQQLFKLLGIPEDGVYKFSGTWEITSENEGHTNFNVEFRVDYVSAGKMRWRNYKAERGNVATAWSPAPADTETSISNAIATSKADLEAYKELVTSDVNNLQNQIDGAIATFTGSTVPTLDNYPASDWTDNTERDKHVGDLFIVDSDGGDNAGFLYRFMYDSTDSTYKWVNVPDNEVQKAIKDSQEALSTANDANSIASDANSTASTALAAANDANTAATSAMNAATSAQESADKALSSVEIIVGTQTASTGSWTGVASFSELKDGQKITYFLPYAGSGNATLNLTLSDGTKTGAKNCYTSSTTRLTTHYPQGSPISLIYRKANLIGSTSYEGWWVDSYRDSDTYDRIRFNNNIKAKTAISSGYFIVGDSSGYFHLGTGVTFDISKPILYAGSAISAAGVGTNNYLSYPSRTLRNNFGSSWTGTIYTTAYLACTVSGKMYTVVKCTSDIPTEEDGYTYIALGTLYSTYAIYLVPEHPMYKFVNGEFKSLSQVGYEAYVTASENTEKVTTLETELSVVQGQISSKVWQTDIESAVEGISSGTNPNILTGTDFQPLLNDEDEPNNKNCTWMYKYGYNPGTGKYIAGDDVYFINRTDDSTFPDECWSNTIWVTPFGYGIDPTDAFIQNMLPLSPNTYYAFSMWIKATDDLIDIADETTVNVLEYTRSKSEVNLNRNNTLTTDWQYVSYTFKTTSVIEGSSYRIEIYPIDMDIALDLTDDKSTANKTLEVWITGVKLEQGKTATQWCPSTYDTKEISDRYTTLTQTVDGITTEVGDVKTTVSGYGTRIEAAESAITQNADSIATKVSKDGIISSINQSAEEITIDANKISINGLVEIINKDSNVLTGLNTLTEFGTKGIWSEGTWGITQYEDSTTVPECIISTSSEFAEYNNFNIFEFTFPDSTKRKISIWQSGIDTVAGEKYILSCYAKALATEQATEKSEGTVTFDISIEGEDTTKEFDVGLQDGWTLLEMTFTASEELYVSFGIECSNELVVLIGAPRLILASEKDSSVTYIDGNKIITGSIVADQIASKAITADKIAADSITVDKIKIGETNKLIWSNAFPNSAFPAQTLRFKNLNDFSRLAIECAGYVQENEGDVGTFISYLDRNSYGDITMAYPRKYYDLDISNLYQIPSDASNVAIYCDYAPEIGINYDISWGTSSSISSDSRHNNSVKMDSRYFIFDIPSEYFGWYLLSGSINYDTHIVIRGIYDVETYISTDAKSSYAGNRQISYWTDEYNNIIEYQDKKSNVSRSINEAAIIDLGVISGFGTAHMDGTLDIKFSIVITNITLTLTIFNGEKKKKIDISHDPELFEYSWTYNIAWSKKFYLSQELYITTRINTFDYESNIANKAKVIIGTPSPDSYDSSDELSIKDISYIDPSIDEYNTSVFSAFRKCKFYGDEIAFDTSNIKTQLGGGSQYSLSDYYVIPLNIYGVR